MATQSSIEAPTCVTISGNDSYPHTTTTNTTPPSSDDGEQGRAPGTMMMTEATQEWEETTMRTEEKQQEPQTKVVSENKDLPLMEKEALRTNKEVSPDDTEVPQNEIEVSWHEEVPQSDREVPQKERDLRETENVVPHNDREVPQNGTETSWNGEQTLSQEHKQAQYDRNQAPCTKQDHRESILSVRLPKLKREKSYSETLERKKKKVKFSTSDCEDDVIVDTRVFDPQATDTTATATTVKQQTVPCSAPEDGAVSSTLKKLLRKRSKKRKANIETQTDEKKADDNKHVTKARKSGGEGGRADTEVTVQSDDHPLDSASLGATDGDTDMVECARAVDRKDSDVLESLPNKIPTESASPPKPPSDAVTGSPNEAGRRDMSDEATLPSVPYPAVPEDVDGVAGSHGSDECLRILENEHGSDVPDSSCEINDAYYEGYTGEFPDNAAKMPDDKDASELRDDEEASIPEEDTPMVSCDSDLAEQSQPGLVSDSTTPSSQATVKREGTFTLDGPPPAKITKSVARAEKDDTDDIKVPSRDSVMEPLQFFVPMDTPVPDTSKSPKTGKAALKEKTNKESTTPSTKPRPGRLNISLKMPTTKSTQEKTSPVTVLKNNARKTFVNVLRTAIKPQEVTEKATKHQATEKTSPTQAPRVTPTAGRPVQVSPRLRRTDSKNKSVKWERQASPAPAKEQPERPSRCREPRKNPQRTPVERTSVLGGVSLSGFRREGTFTKKYDSERDRLQAECNKLSVERDRFQSELQEARTRLEEERAARKALRRSHELSLRQLREGEARRIEVMLADVRNRLEDEKRMSLTQLRDVLTRTHEAELQRVGRERDEVHRRQLQEARNTQEKLRAEIRRECARSEHSPTPCCHCTDRDLERMNRELSTLRDHKKRLEEAVVTLQESERQRVSELRRVHEQHEAAVAKTHRLNKSEAARLLDELRSRERAIGQLERQVSAQAAKIKLHEEKQREGSNDRTEDVARRASTRGGGSGPGSGGGSSSKRHKEAAGSKDGKNKDKESCCGHNNNNNSNSKSDGGPQNQPSDRRSMSVDVETAAHISPTPTPTHDPPTPQYPPTVHEKSAPFPPHSPPNANLPVTPSPPADPPTTHEQPINPPTPHEQPTLKLPTPHSPATSDPPTPQDPPTSHDPLIADPPIPDTSIPGQLAPDSPAEVPPGPSQVNDLPASTAALETVQSIPDEQHTPSQPTGEPAREPAMLTAQLHLPSPPTPFTDKIVSLHSSPHQDHSVQAPSELQPSESQPSDLQQPSAVMAAEVEALRQQVAQQNDVIDSLNQQIEEQKQESEEKSQEMLREMEEQRELFEVERQELTEHIEEKERQVEEQRDVVEAQKQVMEEQKQVMEEQQLRILELAEEVMEQERLAAPVQPTPWHPRRESCVKVSELPTVLEQNSDDETTPTDPTPPTSFPDTSHIPPTALLTPTTPGNHEEPPTWPQVSVSEMSLQYAQLSREHQELQKCYQLLASASSPPHAHAKEGPAAWWANKRVAELEEEASRLRMELQETRDHADLLEFRCLELTEEAEKGSEIGSGVEKRDQSTSTETEEAPSEDLSLPLSIDSGLDLSSDYKKARVSEGRVWLAQLSCAAGDPDCPPALHLAALLDWVAALPAPSHHAPSAPVSPTIATPPKAGMGVEEIGSSMGRDLMVLATRLQESLADPPSQEAVLLDTITKLRVLERSLCGLQERVVSLTEENRELHEAVANLSEAQETRTEASGTESELVHRKTPSIHSDLSDAELSDSPEHLQQGRGGKLGTPLDATTSFQESGIFDTSCDLVHATTQTDLCDLELHKSEYDLHNSSCDLQQAEGDLQSAVARLAAIRSAVQGRDLRHLRVQDLQESEEYLRTALDGPKISMTRVEYESLVNTERELRQELETLKCEKQELECEKQDLVVQCASLRHHIPPQPPQCGTDAEEALKGEVRVLRQRLAMAERAHRELLEEKCELEEEENDSRLMVQRLESQMEAAREMENLLSASLSQEQEISRELHRRVRDLQILEKEHRGRLEKLNSLKCRAEEKAASLLNMKNSLMEQLVFAAYGLLVVEQWRLTVPYSALVPYCGKKLTVLPESALYTNEKDAPVVMECSQITSDNGPHSMRECDLYKENEYVCVRGLCDASVQTYLINSACNHGTLASVGTVSRCDQATMTLKNESLSEREQFYLEQIENLQKEKMTLRKGQDSERRDSLQHHKDLEEELVEVKTQLQEAEQDKCRLLFQLEEMQDEKENIKKNLLQRIEELKGDMSRYNEIFELEKKALQQAHNTQLEESEKERCQLEDKVQQLELQISTFRQELEVVGVAVANDLVEMDADMESMLSQSRKPSMKHTEGDGELLEKIRELVKSETSLRQQISDLEKKECAYHETIREADKIMSSHVTSYKQRIEDLESSRAQQESKIRQLEASEERLRAALRSGSRTSDGERISDLLDRLIHTENSELKLKERVWNLEKNEKELQIKLMEGEKVNQSLRGELRDQEELVHRLMSLETENRALSAELSQGQDSARKVCELQQNESFLRGRVEELEVTENMLRETLHQADLILAQRERKLRDQVSSLQEELQACRSQLEAGSLREHCAREAESACKKQLEDVRTRLAEAEKELMESSSETISHETQHRSEVTKLRNQLKLCNSQLMELDRLNCELRERVVEAEREGQRYASELEELSRRHEQDLVTLNLQVSSRDSRVEELETQVEQLSQNSAKGELDALASTPLPALHAALASITNAVTNCESCSVTQHMALADVSSQLGTLTELLEGQCGTTDAPPSDAEDDVLETAENLAMEAMTTPPPCPAQEGLRDDSSGDDNNNNSIVRRRTRKHLMKDRHQPPPTATPSTILEELEEKVKEMEEVVGVKEEEVRQKEEELRAMEQLLKTKEEELRLADSEASELNTQLQACDSSLMEKSKEMEQLNAALASLRQQLVNTLEEAERTRLSLQANHQVDMETLRRKAEQIAEKVEFLSHRGQLKDSIISTLASQIRAILRSGNMGVIVNQLRCLGKTEEEEASHKQPSGTSTAPAVPDFDVEAVCSFLTQPDEMASLPQSPTLEPPSHMNLQSHISLAPSTTEPGHARPVASRDSSLLQHRKSRIPRILSPSKPSPKPNTIENKPLPVTLKVTKPPVQTSKLVPKTEPKSTSAPEQQRVEPAPQSLQTKPTPDLRQAVNSSPPTATNVLKPVMTSTPAKATGIKDVTKPERPPRLLSDARKVKRMITGVAPLDAAVDCSAAPDWSEDPPTTTPSCVPRPHNLHITRRVGVDGVVIAWDPLEHDCVAGFQVLVGGRVVQHVRSPHRTKALVTALPLAGSFTVGLVAVASDGRCSAPALVTQDRSRVYPGRTAVQRPPRRAVPTAL